VAHLEFSARVLGVVLGLVVAGSLAVVGRKRLQETVLSLRPRLRAAGPSIAVLALVLVLNSIIRDSGGDLSWIIGIKITGYIHMIEGSFVSQLQSLASPPLTAYFSFIYVYGYTFLLIFPIVVYLAVDDPEPLRETAIAYTLNYGIGLVFYIVFIAYGPRNFMPDLVQGLLYTDWPKSQLLTSQVNRNTNVFPSLHSSLSLTVALLAYRTRDIYPRWPYVAVPLAASVAISTMYLGIHWAVDVVAGLVLGAFAVRAAAYIRERTRDGVGDWAGDTPSDSTEEL
jgi:membrane-associated phospholipid phosphatase